MTDQMFSAPIPGQSLTNEVGNVPWEQPPKYVKLNQVVKLYIDKIMSPTGIKTVRKALEGGISATALASVMTKFHVMKGMHSVDIGIVAMPVIVELIITVGDVYGIKYEIQEAEPEEEQADEELARKVLSSFVATPPKPERKGLMARKEVA